MQEELTQEINYLYQSLESVKGTLFLKEKDVKNSEGAFDCLARDFRRSDGQLRSLDCKLDGTRQGHQRAELQMKTKVRQSYDEMTASQHKEAALRARRQQRESTHKEVKQASLEQGSSIGASIAATETAIRFAHERLAQLDSEDAARTASSSERAKLRATEVSISRSDDLKKFEESYRQICRLRGLGFEQQRRYLENEVLAEEQQLEALHAELVRVADEGDALEHEIHESMRETNGIPFLEGKLRDLRAKTDTQEAAIRHRESEIAELKRQIEERNCTIEVQKGCLSEEQEALIRAKELVAQLDALNEKLHTSRANRDIVRGGRLDDVDKRSILRAQIDREHEAVLRERSLFDSEANRKREELEALAADANVAHGRLVHARQNTDEVAAKHYAVQYSVEDVRRRNAELHRTTERTVAELAMGREYRQSGTE